MESIDVSDLPEPFAEAVKAVAESFRRQFAVRGDATGEKTRKPTVELPRWPLGAIGSLSREEIYEGRV